MRKLNLAGMAALEEIVGTVGIIVSLVFVAVGIRSNTAEVRASQIGTIYEGSREIEISVAADPEWVDIVLRGRNKTTQLSEIEQWRYNAYLSANLDLWDKLHARGRDGLMDDGELDTWDAYFHGWAQRYLSNSDWQRLKWQFPGSSLQGKVDAVIMKVPPTAD